MTHTITRAAALIELDGEIHILKLSRQGWERVLAIAAREAGAQLRVACVPNQASPDALLQSAVEQVTYAKK